MTAKLTGAALLLAVITLASGAATAAAQTAPPTTTSVTYRGVRLTVPASWPVYDLSRDPTRCVLFNTSAVYLGDQGPDARCPASAVGVALAVQLHPAVPGVPAAGTAVDNPTAQRVVATAAGGQVAAVISYPAHSAVLTGLLSQLGLTKTTAPVTTANAGVSPPSGPPSGRSSAAPARAAAVPFSSQSPSLGFDTCGAPTASTMATWFAASPYRTAGIYLGGVNRACPDGNLSASWITAVGEQGWNFIPIYVGLQAPCVNQTGLAMIDPASAAAQGRSAADDAVTQATRFGMRAGTPIYFDNEAYNNTVAGCTTTVLTFLSAWTAELHAQNYFSGIYGSSSSTMHDLAGAAHSGGYALPDNIWLANWNGNTALFGDPYVPDGLWSNHQRLHQYSGGHDESYGGITINIDQDSIDGATAIPGNGPPRSLQVFAATSSGQVVTAWQFAPGKPFDPWLGLQFPAAAAGSPTLGVNQNGELQLFTHTSDNRLLTAWQAGASHPFGGWMDMGADGQIVSDATAALDGRGAAQIVVRGGGGRVLTTWQAGPNQPFGGWLDLRMPAAAAGVPVIARQASGALQVLVHTTDNRLLTSWQPALGQAFGGWLDLGLSGQITFDPSVGVNPDGSMTVVVGATRGRVVTAWQPGPNQPFGGWLDLGMPAAIAGVARTVQEANGGQQVFVHTTDNRLLTSWQGGAGQGFGGWLDLGLDGQMASDATAALNADGSMAVFVRGTGGRVLTAWQSGANRPFGGWLDLGVPGSAIAVPQVAMNVAGG